MVVQHNLRAMNANRMLGVTASVQSKSAEKLSSGYKVNRAADDAAGLSISEKMRKQIRGLTQASSNAENGISAVQTAEGALQEVHDMLQRMNELAVQAANGTNAETDRQSIQDEIKQLTTEIDRVAETTKFNETYLLKGGKDTKTKTLNSYDAGLKGTMYDDGGKTATFTTEIKVGDSVSIAGKEYNIIGGKEDSAEKISNVQDAIKGMSASKVVTIEGTAYTAIGSGDSLSFKSGTGTTYSLEELVGKVKDGTTVKVVGYNNGKDVIARDYDNIDKNITIDDAVKRMASALTQANSVGASKTAASVTTEIKGAGVAQTIENGGTVAAKVGLIAINTTTNEIKTIIAGDDITSYAKSGSGYELYKAGAPEVSGSGATAVSKVDALYVHEDGEIDGAKKVAAGTTMTATDQYDAGGAAKAGYTAYSKADLNEVGTFTDASHKAFAKLADDGGTTKASFKLEFEDVKSKEIADGQNALTAEIAKISYTQSGATAGKFAHNFGADSKLDIDETGVVKYNGTKIATITATPGTGSAAGTTQLALDGTASKAEYAESGDKQVFTITKGETEVKQNLTMALHVGADADMTNKINVDIASMDSKGLGIANINVSDDSGNSATYAVDAIENAIKTVSAQRSALGAVQNRLEHTINNLGNVVENTTAAESQIRDTDIATEMVKFSNSNILAQAGQSMLAQANQANQGALSLLG